MHCPSGKGREEGVRQDFHLGSYFLILPHYQLLCKSCFPMVYSPLGESPYLSLGQFSVACERLWRKGESGEPKAVLLAPHGPLKHTEDP